jgi:hypothetical protein
MPRILHMPLPWGGLTVSPRLILIRSRRRGDVALLRHEEKHAEQMRRIGWLRFVWHYLTSRAFRLAMEVEAYRVSIENGRTVEACAKTLAEWYWLGITEDEAAAALRGPAFPHPQED